MIIRVWAVGKQRSNIRLHPFFIIARHLTILTCFVTGAIILKSFQEIVLACSSFLCFCIVTYVYFGLDISSGFIWGILLFRANSWRSTSSTTQERTPTTAATAKVSGEEETQKIRKKWREEIQYHMRKMHISKIAFRTSVRQFIMGKGMVQQCYLPPRELSREKHGHSRKCILSRVQS